MVCYQEGRDSQAREWKKLKVSHCQILKPLLVQVGKGFAKLALFMLSIEFFYKRVNWRCVLNLKNIQNGCNNGDCFQANLDHVTTVLFSFLAPFWLCPSVDRQL